MKTNIILLTHVADLILKVTWRIDKRTGDVIRAKNSTLEN